MASHQTLQFAPTKAVKVVDPTESTAKVVCVVRGQIRTMVGVAPSPCVIADPPVVAALKPNAIREIEPPIRFRMPFSVVAPLTVSAPETLALCATVRPVPAALNEAAPVCVSVPVIVALCCTVRPVPEPVTVRLTTVKAPLPLPVTFASATAELVI